MGWPRLNLIAVPWLAKNKPSTVSLSLSLLTLPQHPKTWRNKVNAPSTNSSILFTLACIHHRSWRLPILVRHLKNVANGSSWFALKLAMSPHTHTPHDFRNHLQPKWCRFSSVSLQIHQPKSSLVFFSFRPGTSLGPLDLSNGGCVSWQERGGSRLVDTRHGLPFVFDLIPVYIYAVQWECDDRSVLFDRRAGPPNQFRRACFLRNGSELTFGLIGHYRAPERK